MSNNSSDLFGYTMNNIMDSFYDNAMNQASEGTFKAVCLSGIKTESNTGEGTGANDGVSSGNFLHIIVRPLTNFGEIIPDPRDSKDPNEINAIISMHASTFTARSDFEIKDTSAIQFAQIVDCYFEKGSVSNSDFRTLRFSEPNGVQIETSFFELATISVVKNAQDADWSKASLLGEDLDKATENNKSSNIKGDRTKDPKYIVIHYSAASGTKQSVLKYENENTDYGYHYMIDRDGSFFNTAPPEKIVWHAKGNNEVNNSNSIGVCLMNAGYEREGVKAKQNWISGIIPNGSKTLKWEPYPQPAIDKLVEICVELIKKFPTISVDRIVGHSDIQNNKQDPGPVFNFSEFRKKVAAKL